MITNIRTALVARRDELEKDEKGFTLIELLVVVLIIGILAAIAIPVFLAQQDQAKDSAIQSDLANAKIAYVSYLVANPDGDTTDLDTLADYGFDAGASSGDLTITTGGEQFCIDGESESSGTTDYFVSYEEGAQKGTCAAGPATAATTTP
jgi:type IV pilus assembly protein PilA